MHERRLDFHSVTVAVEIFEFRAGGGEYGTLPGVGGGVKIGGDHGDGVGVEVFADVGILRSNVSSATK